MPEGFDLPSFTLRCGLVAAIAVLCSILVVPSARADANANERPPSEAAEGWAALGGTAGFIAGVALGTLGTIGLCSALRDESDPEDGVWCALSGTLVIGLGGSLGYGLGRFGLGALAEQNAWSERAGWGGAMTPFGALIGAELALGVTQAVDPDMRSSTRIGVTAASAVAVGVLAYAAGATVPRTADGWRGLLYGTLVGLVLANIVTGIVDAFSYDDGEPVRSVAGLIVPPAVAVALGTTFLVLID